MALSSENDTSLQVAVAGCLYGSPESATRAQLLAEEHSTSAAFNLDDPSKDLCAKTQVRTNGCKPYLCNFANQPGTRGRIGYRQNRS